MDIAKFLSLINSSALYFARLDQLGDPFEGSFAQANLAFDDLEFEDLPKEFVDGLKDDELGKRKWFELMRDSNKRIRSFAKDARIAAFANCWHVQEYESAAMWSQYIGDRDGLAVKTTYARLINALEGVQDKEIFVGMINYLDYRKEAIPSGNLLNSLMCKRLSFEHERELRCLVFDGKAWIDPESCIEGKLGLHIPVSLDVLIDEIYVSPDSADWFLEIVESVSTKYGLAAKVIRSDLASKPLF